MKGQQFSSHITSVLTTTQKNAIKINLHYLLNKVDSVMVTFIACYSCLFVRLAANI